MRFYCTIGRGPAVTIFSSRNLSRQTSSNLSGIGNEQSRTVLLKVNLPSVVAVVILPLPFFSPDGRKPNKLGRLLLN